MSLAQALALHRAGRRREACALYERALDRHPEDARARFAYGLCLLEEGALPEGIGVIRHLLKAHPDHAGGHQALGKALGMIGDGAAETHLRRAVELAPGAPEGWMELGALLALRAPEQAEAVLRQALVHHPRDAALWSNLGNLLGQRGRRREAVECWRRALTLRPGQVEAELALALDRRAEGDVAGAVAMLEAAARRRPDLAELHYNLGVTYHHARKPGLAIAALGRALGANPRFRKASVQLAQAAQSVCDWDTLDRLMPILREEAARAAGGKPCLVSPFFSLSLPFTEAERHAIARAKAQEIAARVRADRDAAPFSARWPRAAETGVLRIGYLCSDFREHPTSHLMAGLFALHDRARVHVTGYSYGPDDGSALRRRVREGCDAFVDLAALDHVEAASRIAADGIQVLVDINGYITHSRPEIAAMRPAPVQATYLAFPGTTGAGFFDYALTDAIVTPPGSEAVYSEALVRLPHSYQVNGGDQAIGPATTRSAEGLPDQGFVFCCFCASFKIEREVFAAWMRLLQQVPDSVLWLYADTPEAERNLRGHAAKAGIAAARLVFATRRPKAEHLARLTLAELFLDTLTYGAHTTASDALWAGVPVVTRRGDAFAGRVGASLLTAIRLPELVAPDRAAYEAKALGLARDPAALAALRARLAANRLAAPLFDTARFARGLEEAYRRMWARHAAGAGPGSIDLADPAV
ncbi:MAG: tetratricopeptide repeat protein [Alphaproteobacteria bacterium]|nr:tetratricopeptide repeat protein [Alphaproteobacteria bacterium]